MICLLFGLCCAGCGKKTDNHVTVSLWEYRLVGEYSDYVQSLVPEADIEWCVGKNDLDFYSYRQEHGDLPDIITNRRFSLLDAYELRDHLLDLSETELAASYHTIYLDKYMNEDGSVNWLPAPGVFDGIIANTALFEKYDIPLPVDYDSFVSACLAFEALGIRGYVTDYDYDYTCMETLQGFSIEALSSLEGKTWRHEYENKLNPGLDDIIWPGVFERMEKLLDANIIKAEEAAWDYYNVNEVFVNGQAAMIRGTGAIAAECIQRDGMEVAALPYFGSSAQENWALTYPVFQAAVSMDAAGDEAHKALTLKVLDAMMSEGAQNILNENSGAQISYNKDISLPLPEEMSRMQPLIDQNHIYIRIASNEFFAASMEVLPKMISGTYDAQQAYAAFNEYLSMPRTKADSVAITFEESYGAHWDADRGNAAASSIANTLRSQLKTDVFMMPYYVVNCGIYAGDQTDVQMLYPVQTYSVISGTMTGRQLTDFLTAMVEVAPAPAQLPVVSGMTLHVKTVADRFHLDKITVDGAEISMDDIYTFGYTNKQGLAMEAIKAHVEEDTDAVLLEGVTSTSLWKNGLTDGQQPLAPSEYIDLK